MASFDNILIIGCGNMGGAMLAGWIAAGVAPERFAVLDPVLDAAPDGVRLYREPPVQGDHSAVLLGVKPQQLGKLAPTLHGLAGKGVTVFSLLAGVSVNDLEAAFPDAAAHVRVMPNLAARIGRSPVILAGSGLGEGARAQALALFDRLGSAHWLDDEGQFDLVTALAGSGPGFVYRFIDALSTAAQELGLAREMADQLALTMVEGAASLAAQGEASPGELADRVASPGGMTREGLNVLDQDNVLKNLLKETLHATRDRGAELARIAREQS